MRIPEQGERLGGDYILPEFMEYFHSSEGVGAIVVRESGGRAYRYDPERSIKGRHFVCTGKRDDSLWRTLDGKPA